MKKFTLIFALASAVFFLQWRNSKEAAGRAAVAATPQAAPSPVSRPVYEHDWAKHALDRAQLVVSQARASRQESDAR